MRAFNQVTTATKKSPNVINDPRSSPTRSSMLPRASRKGRHSRRSSRLYRHPEVAPAPPRLHFGKSLRIPINPSIHCIDTSWSGDAVHLVP
ncbi:hypothetical protein SeMB42_g03812 [Synchytrium endobioticum]|uniref:Uncharacterized protein n=1 Tax=Synchytrium endobioticum TaxID=286115 RepID=A0A507D4C7_9FUNG|nr:hypothetical protein SeMB42_g03812 [Synchytrium endobioticum]